MPLKRRGSTKTKKSQGARWNQVFTIQTIENDCYLALPHRALAAFLAMAFRLLAESASARALPPFKPPFLPISARYADTGSTSSAASSVDRRTISAARRFGSFGSFLERIMHPVLAQNLHGGKRESGIPNLRVAHYRIFGSRSVCIPVRGALSAIFAIESSKAGQAFRRMSDRLLCFVATRRRGPQ